MKLTFDTQRVFVDEHLRENAWERESSEREWEWANERERGV